MDKRTSIIWRALIAILKMIAEEFPGKTVDEIVEELKQQRHGDEVI